MDVPIDIHLLTRTIAGMISDREPSNGTFAVALLIECISLVVSVVSFGFIGFNVGASVCDPSPMNRVEAIIGAVVGGTVGWIVVIVGIERYAST